MFRYTTAALALICLTLPLSAQNETDRLRGLGDPGRLVSISIESSRSPNGRFTLAGRDAWQQLLVTGGFSSGQVRDFTRRAAYSTSPDGIVAVDATGLVTPLREGDAEITATIDGQTAKVSVAVTHIVNDLPVHFANQVVPILTKFGCNGGGCHGKTGGQNGFQLSLLGFEPQDDYVYLVMEGRGRRVLPSAPEHSLLLRKAAGQMGHGGGKLIDPDSAYYKVLRRWIEQGMPYGRATDPAVERIDVLPKERRLDRRSEQQLTVIAHLSDGSTVDVTRMTQFESNNEDMATVSTTGLVTTGDLPGSVAVMARYQSQVDVFQAMVPLGATVTDVPPAKNFVDELVFARLRKLGVPPSGLCDDATFVRRVTIDIAGRLPTPDETTAFLGDRNPDRYERLVDRLLDSPDYAYYFAGKWSAVLRNHRDSANDDPQPTFAFHDWIRRSLDQNKPYDGFVRELLTARGRAELNPAVVWYREVDEVGEQVEDVAQLFLGQRLQCARCHHHPFEKWSQHDYWGMAAFFTRTKVNDPPAPKGNNNQPPPRLRLEVLHQPGTPQATNPRTGAAVPPTGLGAPAGAPDPHEDPRDGLAAWMTDPGNPFFAKALVNRYWKHFLGRGLVEPEDDMRATNPPAHPELLDALARYFVDSKYNLKKLVRVICTSHVYRLGATPNKYNADDVQNFSRFLPRRLTAEVFLDAVDDVTGGRTAFRNMPPGTRAVQLPDNQFESYFLSVFGRPNFASACECERESDASLAQSLHLVNSQEILKKIAGGRARTLARDGRPHAERVRDLYLLALCREPTDAELSVMTGYLERHAAEIQEAYEDVVWTVINTKEFQFNH